MYNTYSIPVHTLDFGNNIGPDGLSLELREAIRTVTQQIHLAVSWLGSHIFVKVEAHCVKAYDRAKLSDGT